MKNKKNRQNPFLMNIPMSTAVNAPASVTSRLSTRHREINCGLVSEDSNQDRTRNLSGVVPALPRQGNVRQKRASMEGRGRQPVYRGGLESLCRDEHAVQKAAWYAEASRSRKARGRAYGESQEGQRQAQEIRGDTTRTIRRGSKRCKTPSTTRGHRSGGCEDGAPPQPATATTRRRLLHLKSA